VSSICVQETEVKPVCCASIEIKYDIRPVFRGVLEDHVANQGYLSWNRPDTSWPNLRPRSTTFILTHSTSCTYVNLIYTYSLVYSVGKSTQSSYTVVDALSTATDHIAAMKRESNEEGLLAPLRLLECQILRLRCFDNGEREFRIIIISPVT
jgi:hypothetical protein